MSQTLVLQLLKELGGKATTKEIAALAEKKYPKSSQHKYVSHSLGKLRKWGEVDRTFVKGSTEAHWFIIKK